MRLRVHLQKKMEMLPLGEIQGKGTGSLKRMFVDDVDSIEILLAHALPEGFGNLAIPAAVYLCLFAVDWKLALMSLASLPVGLFSMCVMFAIGSRDMNNYYTAGKVMNNTIIEYINGMEVVKVFNKDGESYRRYEKDIDAYRDFTLGWYRACWPWMAMYNSIPSLHPDIDPAFGLLVCAEGIFHPAGPDPCDVSFPEPGSSHAKGPWVPALPAPDQL